MKNGFKTTLKGDDVQLSSMPISEGEEIKSIECVVKWSIDLCIEEWGVRYWRTMFESFECTILIDTPEGERKTIISSVCMYNLEIVDDNYKMKDDFTITRIEIDREKETAKAFIQS